MTYSHTKIPNILLDIHLPDLKESELKVILVVLRQTVGWIDKKTGHRKTRDRISRNQFVQKTGLSGKIISKAIQGLLNKGLLCITDQSWNSLHATKDRKGKFALFYSFKPGNIFPSTREQSALSPGNNCTYNKRKYSKENKTKESKLQLRYNHAVSIGDVIKRSDHLRQFRQSNLDN